MTEAEWTAGAHPTDMADTVAANGTHRRCRLFVAACCREVNRYQFAEVCEQWADRPDMAAEVASARQTIDIRPQWVGGLARKPQRLTSQHLQDRIAHAAFEPASADAVRQTAAAAFPVLQRDLIPLMWCVFGNPFRPVTFDPGWRTGTAVALARQMYDARDFDLLPVLADALEDAGCEAADLLAHCRGDGPHVRGCWAVDLVLGKT